MEAKVFVLRKVFARENKIPVVVKAIILKETHKALYLYGHGTLESQKMNICCICGRQLTHPVSVVLGIGPECGSHYWDWDKIGGYSEALLESLKVKITDVKIDQWVPKSVVKSNTPTEGELFVPDNHPMNPAKQIAPVQPVFVEKLPEKYVTLATYKATGEYGVKITFPFDYKVVEQVKTLSGRRFHAEGEVKYWTAPLTQENVDALKGFGFTLRPDVEQALPKPLPTEVPEIKELSINNGLSLKPYQIKGVEFIQKQQGRALLADEMGLGKTAQALTWLAANPTLRPVVIITPASVKSAWKNEVGKWMPGTKVQILSGRTPQPIIEDIVIINYDTLASWVDSLKRVMPKVVITDECHYYKNNNADRTKAIKKLAKNIPHFIALSGTPIVNRPVEMFNAISIINPTLFNSFWQFAQRYCNPINNGYGWNFNGSSNTQELHKKLTDSIMIRRLKKDVLTELPDKVWNYIPVELDNRREYEKASADFIQYVRSTKGNSAAEKASNAQTLAEIEGLKQLAVAGKLKQAISWIEDFLETDEKLVIFATHKFVIEALMKQFPTAVKIDGSTPVSDRQAAVDKFQKDPNIKLFVGNIKAAGVGITLTAASNVAILELPWTPGDLVQAEDRCHRIGQKNAVTIHYLLAEGTIEQKIAELLDKKRVVLGQVLDGHDKQNQSLLADLLDSYK